MNTYNINGKPMVQTGWTGDSTGHNVEDYFRNGCTYLGPDEDGTEPTWGPAKCECSCCDCDEPATRYDDGGNPACDECAEYTTDDDGNVFCSRDSRTETVTESCGAGNQTRSYVRLKPPQMPQADENGEYCLYWSTVGNDSHVVARFTTAELAQQAVEAKDWPKPSDHTQYLCGYEVRQLVDGDWMPLSE